MTENRRSWGCAGFVDESMSLGKKLQRYSYGKRHKCPVCGKIFYVQVGNHRCWKYSYSEGGRRKYCCSYVCGMKKVKEKNGC